MNVVIAAVFNFLIVVGVLLFFSRKPLKVFFKSRSESIDKDIEDASREAAICEKTLSQWASKWNESEVHARILRTEAEEQIERYREEALSGARKKAENIIHQAQLIGEAETSKAIETLQRIAASRAIDEAKQYIMECLSDKDKRALVKNYVETLADGS